MNEDIEQYDPFENFEEKFGWDNLFDEKQESDDPKRDLDPKEIVYMWEKVFNSIGTPDYQEILNEASELFIELPSENYIDPQDMVYSYARAIAFRNKLIRMKIKMRRIYSAKNRSYSSLSRSITGKQKGTKVEKEVGDAKDALDTLTDIIDNLDSTAMQLSRILRLMEIRPNQYYLSRGNTAYDEENDPAGVEPSTGWTEISEINRQVYSKNRR